MGENEVATLAKGCSKYVSHWKVSLREAWKECTPNLRKVLFREACKAQSHRKVSFRQALKAQKESFGAKMLVRDRLKGPLYPKCLKGSFGHRPPRQYHFCKFRTQAAQTFEILYFGISSVHFGPRPPNLSKQLVLIRF